MNGRFKRMLLVLGTVLLAGALAEGVASAATSTSFKMVRSSGAVANDCLEGANANVTIDSLGPVEVMRVTANNLPPEHEVRPVPPPTTWKRWRAFRYRLLRRRHRDERAGRRQRGIYRTLQPGDLHDGP